MSNNISTRFKLERTLPIQLNTEKLTVIWSSAYEKGKQRKDECLYVDEKEKRYYWIYSNDVLNDNNHQIYPSFSIEEVPKESVIRTLMLSKNYKLLERFFPDYQLSLKKEGE